MDMARAHGKRRICHSLWWLLWHCFCLSFVSLWGRLGEARHVLVCQEPIYNRFIFQNKTEPIKAFIFIVTSSLPRHLGIMLQWTKWVWDLVILDTVKHPFSWSIKSLSALSQHSLWTFTNLFCTIHVSYYLIYSSCSLYVNWGGEFLWEPALLWTALHVSVSLFKYEAKEENVQIYQSHKNSSDLRKEIGTSSFFSPPKWLLVSMYFITYERFTNNLHQWPKTSLSFPGK